MSRRPIREGGCDHPGEPHIRLVHVCLSKLFLSLCRPSPNVTLIIQAASKWRVTKTATTLERIYEWSLDSRRALNTQQVMGPNHATTARCRGSGKVSYHTFASLAARRQLQSSLFVVSVGTLPVQHHGMADVYRCSVATSVGKRKLECG